MSSPVLDMLRQALKDRDATSEQIEQKLQKIMSDVCYVCKRPRDEEERIQPIGQGKWRHTYCEAGSPNWLLYRQDSKYYKLFTGGYDGAGDNRNYRQTEGDNDTGGDGV